MLSACRARHFSNRTAVSREKRHAPLPYCTIRNFSIISQRQSCTAAKQSTRKHFDGYQFWLTLHPSPTRAHQACLMMESNCSFGFIFEFFLMDQTNSPSGRIRIGSETSHPGEPDQRPRAGTSRAPPLGGVTSGGTRRSRIGSCGNQFHRCSVGRPECLVIDIQPPRSTSAWQGPVDCPGPESQICRDRPYPPWVARRRSLTWRRSLGREHPWCPRRMRGREI